MMVTLTETRKKWAKRLGYPALGLISFVFALHYTKFGSMRNTEKI